jgi:hypothetical protein
MRHYPTADFKTTMSFFQELTAKYPSWKDLSTYLSSEEGGAFHIRECGTFAILRYKKGVTKITDETAELRSVVWDTVKHAPVCIAPGKAKAGIPPCGVSLCVEEFLDGVMINAFKVLGDPKVYIVSRSQFDAAGTFYSKKTFGELFKEALPTATVEDLFAGVEPTEQNPAYFASFVLQHPEHRVVYRPPKPAIFLVEFGTVTADKKVQRSVPVPLALAKCINLPLSPGLVFHTEEEMMEFLKNESLKRGWTWQGLVFRDASGNRWRLRNPTYTYLRGLRGQESKAEARFLRLRSTGKVSEYLKHYADEKDLFWSLEEKLRSQTQATYDAYCSVHKSHEKTLTDIPHPLKTLVFKLHSYYLNTLREQKTPIQKKHVIDLVNSLPTWEQQLLLSSEA